MFARLGQWPQWAAHHAGVFVFIHVDLRRQQQCTFFQLSFNHFIFLYRDLRFKNFLLQPYSGLTFHETKASQNVSTMLIHPALPIAHLEK